MIKIGIKLIIGMMITSSLVGCQSTPAQGYGPNEIEVKDSILTPEIMWQLGKVGKVALSPDKSTILYAVTYYNIEQNKGNSELYTMQTDGSDKKRITNTHYSESNPQWSPCGKFIYFSAQENDKTSIYKIDADGQKRTEIKGFDKDIVDFSLSADGTRILIIANVKAGTTIQDKYPDLPKANAKLVTDLMYRHWDQWVEEIPHPFVGILKDDQISDITDILENEPYESPMLPFGGIEQLAWSPDGKTVAYTCRKKVGKAYSESTNSDIYLYDIAAKKSVNLTEGMNGYDTNPLFSPDGKKMAFLSMERDGYESDQNRLFVMDLSSGEKTFISSALETNVETVAWNESSNGLYFTACWHALTDIYFVDCLSQNIQKITEGIHDYSFVTPCQDFLIAKKHNMTHPDEIYKINIADAKETELSLENKRTLDQISFGKMEQRWIPTTNGEMMHTWVIYPPHFDPSKKYPTILYCQGGPQSTISQFYSVRWNLQLMAAGGYIIVAPNRHGVPSFGNKWNEQISGDYAGQNMKDYLTAIDELSKEAYVDKDRLGCVGASYGGFSVYWLAGNHNKRFKAFIAHCGIFNLEEQYTSTEEMWFANWDLGGPYWDKNNPIAQRTYAASPHRFVGQWDTPIMVIHGEKDFRIPYTQGMSAFNAAVLRDIPAEFLYFPEETHFVSQPQNSILWHRLFKEWLDKWLKN